MVHVSFVEHLKLLNCREFVKHLFLHLFTSKPNRLLWLVPIGTIVVSCETFFCHRVCNDYNFGHFVWFWNLGHGFCYSDLNSFFCLVSFICVWIVLIQQLVALCRGPRCECKASICSSLVWSSAIYVRLFKSIYTRNCVWGFLRNSLSARMCPLDTRTRPNHMQIATCVCVLSYCCIVLHCVIASHAARPPDSLEPASFRFKLLFLEFTAFFFFKWSFFLCTYIVC